MKNTTKQPDDQAAARLKAWGDWCFRNTLAGIEHPPTPTSAFNDGFDAGYHAAATAESEQPAAEVDDAVVIDGMTIEGGSTIMAQARHNTEALTRLGILDENGDPKPPKPAPAEPLGDECEKGVCECGCDWSEHRDRYYDADKAGSLPGQGPCMTCSVGICPSFNPAPNPQAVEADSYDWMNEARQYAAQCWCDPETSSTIMDCVLAEAIAKRIAAWMQTAAQNQRNADFYRQLLDDCAEHLGAEVFIADDGSVMDSPLRLKIPALVAQLVKTPDLRTALAYEAGQRAERVRIAEELVSIRNSARNDAQEWLVNINELIEKLRGEQNAK